MPPDPYELHSLVVRAAIDHWATMKPKLSPKDTPLTVLNVLGQQPGLSQEVQGWILANRQGFPAAQRQDSKDPKEVRVVRPTIGPPILAANTAGEMAQALGNLTQFPPPQLASHPAALAGVAEALRIVVRDSGAGAIYNGGAGVFSAPGLLQSGVWGAIRGVAAGEPGPVVAAAASFRQLLMQFP